MTTRQRLLLPTSAEIAVIGGGPAGSFFALHLLRLARSQGKSIRVTVFERKWRGDTGGTGSRTAGWHGCNHCAGGISPRLVDVLREMDLVPPADVIQCRIESITIQGYWKNIEIDVPEGREMYSVFRGSRPTNRGKTGSFDSFLLDQARAEGATVIDAQVIDVARGAGGKPIITWRRDESDCVLEADFLGVATGVNEAVGMLRASSSIAGSFARMMPGFVPPKLRPALIFELQAPDGLPSDIARAIHFVEYGSDSLRLEMCSLVPKEGHLTVVLVGESVDRAKDQHGARALIREFLELPHIRSLIPQSARFVPVCCCRPCLTVGSALRPSGHRIAAVGDLVASRLYKDGILSAYTTAMALATCVLEHGIDAASLHRGYEPALQRIRRDNRFATAVFAAHRLIFGSSTLSRVLYQAVISERKTTRRRERHLERMLWRIASGDDAYARIVRRAVHPATLWSVLTGGALVTLRNHTAECALGLDWRDIQRFTTGVALEKLEEKRTAFSSLTEDAGVDVPRGAEFERMYTIRIRAARDHVLELLGRFGDPDRGYFHPRWVSVVRTSGMPNTPGLVIRYEVAGRCIRFSLVLEKFVDGHLLVYRVLDGFAAGGVLIFEVDFSGHDACNLSIYVAFNFARGRGSLDRLFKFGFRLLFPSFLHDVIWNHSLCQLKGIAESGSGFAGGGDLARATKTRSYQGNSSGDNDHP